MNCYSQVYNVKTLNLWPRVSEWGNEPRDFLATSVEVKMFKFTFFAGDNLLVYGFSHIYHRFYDFCYSPVYFSYYRLIISVNLLQTLDQNSPPTNIYFWLFGCNDNSWQVF